jgi:hypothetical protein
MKISTHEEDLNDERIACQAKKMMSPHTANQTSHKAQNTKQIIGHDTLGKNTAIAATEQCADSMDVGCLFGGN